MSSMCKPIIYSAKLSKEFNRFRRTCNLSAQHNVHQRFQNQHSVVTEEMVSLVQGKSVDAADDDSIC
jgi:hypothetical protein